MWDANSSRLEQELSFSLGKLVIPLYRFNPVLETDVKNLRPYKEFVFHKVQSFTGSGYDKMLVINALHLLEKLRIHSQ